MNLCSFSCFVTLKHVKMIHFGCNMKVEYKNEQKKTENRCEKQLPFLVPYIIITFQNLIQKKIKPETFISTGITYHCHISNCFLFVCIVERKYRFYYQLLFYNTRSINKILSVNDFHDTYTRTQMKSLKGCILHKHTQKLSDRPFSPTLDI